MTVICVVSAATAFAQQREKSEFERNHLFHKSLCDTLSFLNLTAIFLDIVLLRAKERIILHVARQT